MEARLPVASVLEAGVIGGDWVSGWLDKPAYILSTSWLLFFVILLHSDVFGGWMPRLSFKRSHAFHFSLALSLLPSQTINPNKVLAT
jgi:hypothetical protein